MLCINEAVATTLLNQFAQTLLSFDERQQAKIFAIEPQQVENIEHWLTSARKQFIELTDALRIEAHDFTVENRILAQIVERFFQGVKRLEAIQVSRDEFAFASVDVRERTEAVVFQFKDVIVIVKGLRYQSEPHRVNAWQHISILALRRHYAVESGQRSWFFKGTESVLARDWQIACEYLDAGVFELSRLLVRATPWEAAASYDTRS
jgi:hypothetical protein